MGERRDWGTRTIPWSSRQADVTGPPLGADEDAPYFGTYARARPSTPVIGTTYSDLNVPKLGAPQLAGPRGWSDDPGREEVNELLHVLTGGPSSCLFYQAL